MTLDLNYNQKYFNVYPVSPYVVLRAKFELNFALLTTVLYGFLQEVVMLMTLIQLYEK